MRNSHQYRNTSDFDAINKFEKHKVEKKEMNLWSRPLSQSEYSILYIIWIIIAYISDYLIYICKQIVNRKSIKEIYEDH